LLDCSKSFKNQGCKGGLMDYSFEYVKSIGISVDSIYPYTGVEGNCTLNGLNSSKISAYTDISGGNCKELSNAL